LSECNYYAIPLGIYALPLAYSKNNNSNNLNWAIYYVRKKVIIWSILQKLLTTNIFDAGVRRESFNFPHSPFRRGEIVHLFFLPYFHSRLNTKYIRMIDFRLIRVAKFKTMPLIFQKSWRWMDNLGRNGILFLSV